MIDRSTRWLEAVPLKDTSATSCADTFVATWVARFGVPECITSDHGPQFTSAVWSALCSRLGISRSLTTAFHPQSNGMVERAHRQLKDAMRARAAGHDWPSHLPWPSTQSRGLLHNPAALYTIPWPSTQSHGPLHNPAALYTIPQPSTQSRGPLHNPMALAAVLRPLPPSCGPSCNLLLLQCRPEAVTGGG